MTWKMRNLSLRMIGHRGKLRGGRAISLPPLQQQRTIIVPNLNPPTPVNLLVSTRRNMERTRNVVASVTGVVRNGDRALAPAHHQRPPPRMLSHQPGNRTITGTSGGTARIQDEAPVLITMIAAIAMGRIAHAAHAVATAARMTPTDVTAAAVAAQSHRSLAGT